MEVVPSLHLLTANGTLNALHTYTSNPNATTHRAIPLQPAEIAPAEVGKVGGFILDQFEGVHHPVERVPVPPRPASGSCVIWGGGGEHDHGEPLLVNDCWPA